MSEPLFGIDINIHLFGKFIQIQTPQWNREYHRPSWYPKWKFEVIDDIPCAASKWFWLDWFFHLTIAYGSPATGNKPQEELPPAKLSPKDEAEFERLCAEFDKRRKEDGGVWPEYTGDSR